MMPRKKGSGTFVASGVGVSWFGGRAAFEATKVPDPFFPLAVAAVCVLLGAARASGQEIEMTIVPADDQTTVLGPCRPADLTLTNRSKDVLREVRLRWAEGGPTVICPVALASGASQEIRVFLPAGSPLQTYHVTFQGDPSLSAAEVTIRWPIEQAARAGWLSPSAYEPYDQPLPSWSDQVRLNVMLGAGVLALAAAAVLFLQPTPVRTCAMLLLVAAGTGAGAIMLANTDVLVEDVVALDVDTPQPGMKPWPGRNLYVVASRRTVQWSHPDAHLAPVYKDESQMYDEAMTLDPRSGASVAISPGQLHLFRATARGQ